MNTEEEAALDAWPGAAVAAAAAAAVTLTRTAASRPAITCAPQGDEKSERKRTRRMNMFRSERLV